MVIDTNGKRVCKQCGKLKPYNCFYKQRRFICKECHSWNCHLYYLENKQRCKDNFWNYYRNNKEKHKECCRRWLKKNKWAVSYHGHKHRAKERGINFELTGKDVKELFKSPKLCAITGKRLKHNRKKPMSDSPCICRKNFFRGYTKKSVQLVSFSETMKRVGLYNKKRNQRK